MPSVEIIRSLIISVTLCILLSACSGAQKEDESFTGAEGVQNNADTRDVEPIKEEKAISREAMQESVIQEETKAADISEEPENIRILRKFYNANCLGKVGKVFFMDLTGDGEDEMIVLEKDTDRVDAGSLWQEQKMGLSIYQDVQGRVEEIYHASGEKEMFGDMVSATGTNYYLCIEDEKAEIVLEQCADSEERVSVEKLRFENSDTTKAGSAVMPQEEFKEKRKCSILLLDSFTAMTPAWDIKQELSGYQDILDCKREIADVIKIAEAAEETVLDYSVIAAEDDQCIFAVTGVIRNCQADKEYQADSYEGVLSVWASYDGQAKKLDDSYNAEEEGYWIGSELYQVGGDQHYFFITGLGGSSYITYAQHKYCFEDCEPHRIEDNHIVKKDENGKAQMKLYHNVEELNGNYLTDAFDAEIMAVDSVDIVFQDHQYTEYAAEIVEGDTLEKYDNFGDILQLIEEAFQECYCIGEAPAYLYGMMDYCVQRTELDHVRKTANDVFYLNYKVYGRRLGWNSVDFFDEYSEECDVWAYAVVETVGNQLEFKRIVFGQKREFSTAGR